MPAHLLLRARTIAKTFWTRLFFSMSSSSPLSHSRSVGKSLPAVTVVTVRKSAWLIVMLTDELMGRLSLLSRLPQYLITAMFVGLATVTCAIC